MARESASMEGVIDSIIYKNEENGYTIARALLDDGGELTLVGTIPFLGAGEHISATGTVTLHPQHGPQFQVESYYREMPQTEEDIYAYLASRVVKGVGPKTAAQIVDRFGTESFEVLASRPEELAQIRGITLPRAREIQGEFLRLTALRLLLEYLTEHHLPTWYAAGLTAAYGDRAAAELERNPYILCREPYLLPFSQADALAAEAGIEGDSALRLEAGVLYVLSFNLQAGHTFLPRQKLLATAGQLLGREGDGLEPVLEALLDRKALRQETLLGLEAVYLAPVYDQEAFAAAQAVAQNPAQNYNPLFIYGDSGLGKTHLIYAIAHVIRSRNRNARIAYVKGDDLTNELVAAIQAGPAKSAEMREKYRQADLLLVDDVQFIAGRKQTQEEFFHTFNTLYESGKQIVLTSDRPPHEMTQLEDRLMTRFEWGLLVDVSPPDFETRMAIVKNKAAMMGLDLPDKIASYIAENVTANVRQLEGTVNKIKAYKDLLGSTADEETVNRAIQDMLKRSNEYIPSPSAIIDYICKYYNLEEAVLRGQQRNRDAVLARQIAMYLIRSMTNLSLDDIGREFGNRDHSTVIHSLDKVEEQMKKSPTFAETVKEIKTNINSRR